MPNKTIYVSDDDLPLYQRAQELAGGSLSAAIVTALRRYIELEEGLAAGFQEITVKVGHGQGRKQRFVGTLLGEVGTYDSKTYATYRVYGTRKHKYVLHVEHGPDYVSKTEGWRSHLGLAPGSWGVKPAEYRLEIFDSLEELKAKVPEELYAMVADSADPTAVEDLDI